MSWLFILASQALSILLLPHNIPDSLKHLTTMVDDIWYYAGDRSTDVSDSFDPKSTSLLLALTQLSFIPLQRSKNCNQTFAQFLLFWFLKLHCAIFDQSLCLSDELVHPACGTNWHLQHHRACDGARLVS